MTQLQTVQLYELIYYLRPISFTMAWHAQIKSSFTLVCGNGHSNFKMTVILNLSFSSSILIKIAL